LNCPIEIFWIHPFLVEMSLAHRFSSFREFKKYKDQLNSSDEIVKQSVSSEEGPKMKLSKFKSQEDLRTDSSIESSDHSLKVSKKHKSTTSLRELKPQKILTYDEQQKEKKQAKLLIFLDKHELPEPITLDSLLETLSETWEEDQDDVIWS
jgi:hypothetical protein